MERYTIIIKPEAIDMKIIAGVIKKGGIVIYPTESSYAIGCDFTNKKAVSRLFKIKKRPVSKHTIVIVDSLKTAKKYCKLNKNEIKLVKAFMPGPLTICAHGKNREFNFRISSNEIANSLAKYAGVPIVATSANISNEPNIYDVNELKKFYGLVDLIINAGRLPKRKASTVVKLRKNVEIIRKGAISKSKIYRILNKK